MRWVNAPRVAAVVFVALVGGLVALNAVALGRQRSSTIAISVAGRQQVLAEQYLQEILLRVRGERADPAATMDQLSSTQDALLDGGQVQALQGSPDDTFAIRAVTSSRVRAKLDSEQTLVHRLRRQGTAFLHLPRGDPRTPAQLLQLRITTALLWSTTRDVVGEMTRQSDSSVNRLVRLELVIGAVGIIAALGIGLLFSRSARRGASARFRSLVTHATDLVLCTDGEGTVTYVSPSAVHILGYPPETLIGSPAADLIHPDDLAMVSDEVLAILGEPGRTVVLTCRTRHADGHWIEIESTYTNLLSDPSVQGVVVNGRDVTENKRLVDELAHKAFHDDLTGLANRALLRDRLEHALARAQRTAATVTLLFGDLDGFKMINDSLGHDAGNLLLVEVAGRLERNVRDGDTIARLGGDEFAILLDESAPGDATTLAARLLDAMRAPFVLDGREVHIRASIGIADNSIEPLDADQLLIRADIAMYAAKTRGRDRFETFDDPMQSELTDRHEVHGDLRHALDNHELEVHYQPLIDLVSGRIESFEALLRWNHPTRGTVGPNVFIPIAEETGLIVPIGRFVLQEACRQVMEWRNTYPHHADLSVGVNVAAAQLQDPDFVTDVERVLNDTGLSGRNLVLELTETTLLSDTATVQSQLRGVKRLGVQIAIDDFGTGYSSLAYLRTFPVDYLKIDQSFVNELDRDMNDDTRLMVQSIIGIGHNLNLRVVAEGIEHTGQLNELVTSGCNIGQGYLFARPAPPDAITTLLADPDFSPGTNTQPAA